MDQILDAYPQEAKLPEDASQAWAMAAFRFLSCFSELAKFYLANKVNGVYCTLFNITIKCHYLAHIALRVRFLNPRKGWCYTGEDFMQQIKRVAAASCKGNKIYRVGNKIIEKYCWGMHFRLLNGDSIFR